jgi:hypothetical protein
MFVNTLLRNRDERLVVATTNGSNGVTHASCIQQFDQIMERFLLRGTTGGVLPAGSLEIVLSEISALASGFDAENSEAASVFEDIPAKTMRSFPKWRAERYVDCILVKGYEDAKGFLAESLSPDIQDRLDDPYSPIWDVKRIDDISRELIIDYKQDRFLIYFAPNCGYSYYLAQGAAFAHRFCSHVYSSGQPEMSRQFYDGWLCYAVARYIVDQLVQNGRSPGLADRLLKSIAECLPANPKDAWGKAYTFHNLTRGRSPDLFWDLTLDLIAFKPGSSEEKHWPDRFLKRLWDTFKIQFPVNHGQEFWASVDRAKRRVASGGRRRVSAERLNGYLLPPQSPPNPRATLWNVVVSDVGGPHS